VRRLDTLLGAPMQTGRFLRLAAGIAAVLAELHSRKIIHEHIEPRNILVDPETFAVKLTGVPETSFQSLEYPVSTTPLNVELMPAYMSPEQTGRMNRSIDHRTDLYSLGVTLYEMLTDAVPFQAVDILEWAHCHIARTPRPPKEVIPDIPFVLSDMVMKLLEKDPEERYQTAAGLRYDLEKCIGQWEAAGEIEQFSLGERDISDRLLIPQRLYGRERDIETLLSAFDRVVASGMPEMVMVAGYSGIGKTSLVRELYAPIVRERGYFISGKFDQYKREIPYSTIVEAFREMIRQILTESGEHIAEWKRQLQEALGINGQLIVDVIPQVELIIGPQLPVPELPPTEARYRFNMVFRRFMGVFAKKEHPLIVFFDDLQWVDAASLRLLEQTITNPDIRYLLLIGAYRDNEVSPSHPLMMTLNDIRKREALVETITLSPLSFDDLSRLMADTLRADPGLVEPLTRLVHEKTAGNPFFVIQFLKTLHGEGLVNFDGTERLWKWDIARIREKGYTDNVVDLMVGKLRKLSEGTLRELRLAACIGNRFDLHTLALISGIPDEETRELLRESLWEGLVLRPEDSSYRFLHDRVQEAAYSLVPEARRAGLHLRIGRLLLADTPEDRLEERVFDIVSHFNRVAGLITSRQERERVAELNLVAGKRAKGSTAYVSALSYLAAGTALLAEDSWDRQYNLTFKLKFHRAECEFLTGDLTAAEERLSMLRRRAGNLINLAAVTCLSLDLYTTMDQSDRGIEVCLEYLRRVGIDWSQHPTKDEVEQEYERIWRQLGSRPIENLIDLPPMTDPNWRVTMDVLTALMPAALFTDQNLLCLSIGRMTNLSLEHGHCDGSSLAYVWLGMILGPYFGDFRDALRFGKLGLGLVEQGLDRFKARVYLCFANFVNLWARHIRTSREWQRRAFDTATKIGDLTFAAYSCNSLITNLLASGEPLADVQREAEARLVLAREMGFGLFIDIVTTQLRLVRMLRGLTPSFSSFNDEEFDEDRFEQHLEEDPRLAIGACWYWIRKLQARFHAGDFASALEAAAKAEPLLWTSPAFFEAAEYQFYAGLALAGRWDEASPHGRPALAAHQKQLGLWAENCPENFLNRFALVSAEAARLEGREVEAMRLYEQAIRSARDNGFVQNEAIAFELASGFYRTRDFETIADAYLRNARACYLRWGADGKVKQLDEQFPWLREEESVAAARGIGGVDAITVVKASQAISGEMLLSNLLDTLMRIVIENAGAQKGCLLLVRGEDLSIEAQAGVKGEEIKVLLEAPSRLSAILPESIINYVRRTRESVILDDAAEDNVFSPDEYIVINKPVSILCMPVLRHAELIGLLYLENDSVKGAFTPDRIAVLEALAAQAAISLENSMLYAALDASRAQLQSIMDNSTAVIYVKDLEGRYLLINRRFEKLFHVTRETVAGKTDYDLFPRVRADAFRALDCQVLATGSALEAEEVVPHDDGLHTYISIKAPLYNAAGKPYAVCGISADITERKRAEEGLRKARVELEQKVLERTTELSEANVKLREMDRLKSMFIASMSHELRTPLNSIIGFSSILLDEWVGPLNEEQKENLAVILRSGKHLLALINDVIDVSKIEAGKIGPLIEKFDIHDLIAEAVNLMIRDARGKGLALNVESIHLTMTTDRRRLLQSVINLLGNAVKFTEKGFVRVAVRRVDETVEITVEDTGAGIRKEDMPKLFQPFIRLVSPDKAAIPGTGLGLYLTGRLVREVLKGDIMCQSIYGSGSIFSIKVPVRIE
jgi:PAS domain S-box-containing protein